MKKCLFLILIVLICPLFFIGCSNEVALSSYNLVLCYNDETHILDGEEKISYVNNTSNSFKELCFHLYPNAFREDAKERVVSLANYSTAYPNGASYGSIDVLEVAVENKEVDFKVEGEDCNILTIPLVNELFPDESVDLEIKFSVTLPNVHHRFGYGENSINLANFYPIACAYEEGEGFKKDLYTSNGDPFYSDVANYNVTIRYNNNLTLASTGNLVSSEELNDEKTEVFKAYKVRDFAMVLSPKFQIETAKLGNIMVNYYYYNDETPQSTLALATNCLKFYSEKFGQYPYEQISVVQSNFVYGGMEYPNLVMISDTLSVETSYYVIAHEIAHQWWYGVVGNDEYSEAWVDESLTEYSTTLFFENYKEYGFEYNTLVTNANTTFKFYYDIYESICKEVNTSMNRTLREYETEPEYVHSVYTQGVIMYDSLRELIGEKRFYKCCEKYFEKMAYKNASGADLIAIFSSVSGRNLESFFNSYLDGNVIIK